MASLDLLADLIEGFFAAGLGAAILRHILLWLTDGFQIVEQFLSFVGSSLQHQVRLDRNERFYYITNRL